MSSAWVRQLAETVEHEACVLVTLRLHKGSAPRESGARMVVSAERVHGSIGGGNLEFEAIATARQILESRGEHLPRLEPYGLGPALNQCCGGSVELMFEWLSPPLPEWLAALQSAAARGDHAVLATATVAAVPGHFVALPVGRESNLPESLRRPVRALLDGDQAEPVTVVEADGTDWWLQRVEEARRRVVLFGAGHVGKAVVKMLAELPFEVRWVDGREDEFPEHLPANASKVVSGDALGEVAAAPPGATFIVMTHSHDLDEDICHAVLQRSDFAFLGLIGSKSKARRFVHRLGKRGIAESQLKRLACPLGLAQISGKEPATIALSLAAQLMSNHEDTS